ncbi:hypothetical protein BMF94_3976 [Rhodotorula taiwanensis]|uniref:Uncharacterized protein n=1 Tax=Rhodotorula taiwanensis TaxID=741276 RepID=A0A2S5B888_9BASI|nr:hypothetical protein BMF94_3976 [Rhodotorula taiwanensis]
MQSTTSPREKDGVRLSVWKMWFQILIHKIRWSVTVRHSPRIAEKHPGRPIDDILRIWEESHNNTLSPAFLQTLEPHQLGAIYRQFMSLAVAVFKSSVEWHDEKYLRLSEDVERSLKITELPEVPETPSPERIPNPFPRFEWRQSSLPAKWFPDLLVTLKTVWTFGSGPAAAKPERQHLTATLLEWRENWNLTLGDRTYLARLTPEQSSALDLFVSLTLFNAVKVKIVEEGAARGVEAGFEKAAQYLVSLKLQDVLKEINCPPPLSDHPQHASSSAEHALGSQPRIARRIARTVYGVDPAEWQRRRFGR